MARTLTGSIAQYVIVSVVERNQRPGDKRDQGKREYGRGGRGGDADLTREVIEQVGDVARKRHPGWGSLAQLKSCHVAAGKAPDESD
jgi:hypothetical protein